MKTEADLKLELARAQRSGDSKTVAAIEAELMHGVPKRRLHRESAAELDAHEAKAEALAKFAALTDQKTADMARHGANAISAIPKIKAAAKALKDGIAEFAAELSSLNRSAEAIRCSEVEADSDVGVIRDNARFLTEGHGGEFPMGLLSENKIAGWIFAAKRAAAKHAAAIAAAEKGGA